MGTEMSEMTANGPRTVRWVRLKKLARSMMLQKQKSTTGPRREAYTDYWQVRNHRATTPTEPSRK